MSLVPVKPAAAPRRVRLALALILALAAAPRLYLALSDNGISWPDEIYQSLEPAHRMAFGYGLSAWEFRRGARNVTFAALLAGVMRGAATAGLDWPAAYLLVVRLALLLLALAAIGGVYLLSRRFAAPPWVALFAAAAAAIYVPNIYFAHRALGEVASMALVALGFYLALEIEGRRWRRLLGVSLLGLAVLLRPHNGLWALGLLCCLAAWRSWRVLAEATATLLLWALLYGLIDRVSWGGWFSSLAVYLDVNVSEDFATRRFGRQSPLFYLVHLATAGGVASLTLLLAPLSLFDWRRALAPLLLGVGFVAAHSLVAHKELRFVLPALPLLFCAAAIGLTSLAARAPSAARVLAGVALALALLSLARAGSLTYRDLGITSALRAGSAYDWPGQVNRLLLAAHARRDLCGLMVSTSIVVHTGGYAHLHRRVPLYARDKHAATPAFNYRIGLVPRDDEQEVARQGHFVLLRRAGRCVRASYDWRAN